MMSNDTLCVKFITNQAKYNENNHMRVEYHFLERLYAATKDSIVRVPFPVFLRIHAREGHSYGMEKIKGASLSQMLEFPDLYPDILEIARGLNREQAEADLVAFVEEMHAADVVHCDLYMRNVMLGSDGRLYVIDFGKSKNIDFKGEKEEERKSDLYNARESVRDFFRKLDKLTEAKNSI
jgi:tRNA A-37 threonylcarbamoyl transferase component Bud32